MTLNSTTTGAATGLSFVTLPRLLRYLEQRGNTISHAHRSALKLLVDTLANYLYGHDTGRKVFSLDPGLGKTSALVALASALHVLGLRLPFSVAASQVSALSNLKRDMLAEGVPESWIGLRHAKRPSEVEAEGLLPSTGDESRLIQLVTHERIKQGRTRDLFLMHDGQPRRLCVWDETLLKSLPYSKTAQELRQAIASAMEHLRPESSAHEALLRFFVAAKDAIRAAEDIVVSSPGQRELLFDLPVLEGVERNAAEDIITTTPRLLSRDLLLLLLDIAELEQVRMLRAQDSSTGVISYRIAVPPELRNIVVLDASWTVRELVKLDATVQHEDCHAVKRYDSVTFHQMQRAGGRNTAAGKASKVYAAEAAEVIAKRPDSNVLVFAFMEQNSKQTQMRDLRDALSGRGINLDAPAVGLDPSRGRKRINVTHWGRETSVNDWDHCDTVILLGVLHRDPYDLMAHVKGQLDNFDADAYAHLESVQRGEILHLILQASLRGCGRKTEVRDGVSQAKKMDVFVIHRHDNIELPLTSVLPGAKWVGWLPSQKMPSRGGEKSSQLAVTIRDFLLTVPAERGSLSTKRIKRALEDHQGEVDKATFTKALRLALKDPQLSHWRHEGRSVVHLFADMDAAKQVAQPATVQPAEVSRPEPAEEVETWRPRPRRYLDSDVRFVPVPDDCAGDLM